MGNSQQNREDEDPARTQLLEWSSTDYKVSAVSMFKRKKLGPKKKKQGEADEMDKVVLKKNQIKLIR